MKLIDIHWGWITPGVGQANRKRQLDGYMDILESRADKDERFYFTQTGWVMDIDQADEVRRITTTSPEHGKADGPMQPEQLERFKAAVRRGQLVYAVYPYSGAVIEGMVGEAVLQALRLSQEIATHHFGVAPTGFFVHDGPFQLDWNAPMIPQIGLLAGFSELLGRNLAVIESLDGSRLPMLGQPHTGIDLLYTGTEAPHLPVHMGELNERFGELSCVTATEVENLLKSPNLPVVYAEDILTKGWYGGAPLVMQQQAALRRTDLATSLVSFNQTLHCEASEASELDDLWKSSLILQDCHLQWLLADVDAHYLPLARELEAKVCQKLKFETECSFPLQAFNPLPHTRSGVVPVGDQFGVCLNIAPASTGSVDCSDDNTVRATPTSLENNLICVELGSHGDILSITTPEGKSLYNGVANQLCHWVNRPAEGDFLLRLMSIWDEDFSGCLRLETEVDVSADGVYPLFFDIVRGMAVAVAANGDDWERVTNAHWGGGLPSGNQEHGYSQTCDIKLNKGRNRLVMHAVADEGFKLKSAALRLDGNFVQMQYWQGHKVLEWTRDPFVVEDVDVHDLGARAEVVFHGRFSTCAASLTVALDHNSERVDVQFTRSYAERVYEGLQTLPLPPEVGSYLGSYCERPYVPAFTVEHQTARQTSTYASDKPYGYAAAEDSDRAWHTGRFCNIFGGLAPFLGIFTGIAESPAGSMAMLTDGHGHFFRRRPQHEHIETLGLSLGSSIIHPMTQNYRMPAGSYWEKIGRLGGVDYDDSHERFDFICPQGDITCSWSLLFSPETCISRQYCHTQLLDSLFPLLPANMVHEGGFELEGAQMALTGMERTMDGSLRLRLLNFDNCDQPFALTLPCIKGEIEVINGMPMSLPTWQEGRLTGILPPLAVRELVVKKKED